MLCHVDYYINGKKFSKKFDDDKEAREFKREKEAEGIRVSGPWY